LVTVPLALIVPFLLSAEAGAIRSPRIAICMERFALKP
jgi:hypothetical protein